MTTCNDCGLRYEVIVDVCSVLSNGIRVAGEPLDFRHCPACGSDNTEVEEFKRLFSG